MKVLFTTHPAYGHFQPLLPLARALRSAGHDVRVAASERFQPVIEAAGLKGIAAGLNWLEADKSTVPDHLKPSPDSTLEEYFAQQFVAAPAELLAHDVVVRAGEWSPDLVVRERTEFGGAIAADALGIPSAAVQVASPSLITPAVLAAVDAPYNAARAALGLSEDRGLRQLESRVVLSFSPPELHAPGGPRPSQFLSFRPAPGDQAPDSVLPDWAQRLGEDRPLVYATLGTVFNNPSYELPFFPAVLGALRNEPVDLVVTVGPNVDPRLLGQQPDHVHIVSYLPQGVIVAKAAAIVCHGGFGTLVSAIVAGVPLVVVPFGADQFINAESVGRLAIGLVLEEEEADAERMRSAIRSVLDEPAWRQNIEQLRDAGERLPGLPEAVATLERLVARD